MIASRWEVLTGLTPQEAPVQGRQGRGNPPLHWKYIDGSDAVAVDATICPPYEEEGVVMTRKLKNTILLWR